MPYFKKFEFAILFLANSQGPFPEGPGGILLPSAGNLCMYVCLENRTLSGKEKLMINKVILVGRLGGDPEVRYTPEGLMIVNFTLATDEQRKDKNGERVQKTEWHRIVTFGKLAEICSSYLTKGRLVFIEGRIQTRGWEDKEGVKRYTTEIIANNMQMLEAKGQQKAPGATAAEGATPPYLSAESLPDDDVPF